MDSELRTTQRWVTAFVVGKRLCPFAGPELQRKGLHYALSRAKNIPSLLEDLGVELQRLQQDEQKTSSVLVHPWVLTSFVDYNDFLDLADDLLATLKLDGAYQIASFHPDYQFADTDPADAENFSNRSPYPMLHLLPESLVSEAVATHPKVEQIGARNIEVLRATGSAALLQQWRACFEEG